MKIDKKHSLFWNDGQNKFFILRLKDKDVFVISVFDNNKPHHVFFSGDDFSSFICEVVKYCLDLPIVARGIPCPIDLSKKFHGCLRTQKAKVMDNGGLMLKFDKRWLEYHGYPEEVIIKKKRGVIYIEPVKGGKGSATILPRPR